jgi:hypothetical protein
LRLDDYYGVLGVDRAASSGVLRHAFHARLLSIHPDRNPGDLLAAERTRNVIEAYKVLSTPARRREYDCALLKIVRPVPVAYCGVDSEVGQGVARAVGAFAVIGFAIYLLLTLIASILASRTPVFTFCVATMRDTGEPRMLPQLLDPSISDCREWYHTQQLQVGLVNRWLVGEAMKVYSDALVSAERQGDGHRADFYRASMNGIRTAETAEVSRLVREPNHRADSHSPNPDGAKGASASS